MVFNLDTNQREKYNDNWYTSVKGRLISEIQAVNLSSNMVIIS